MASPASPERYLEASAFISERLQGGNSLKQVDFRRTRAGS
jgi:hypothetical protein